MIDISEQLQAIMEEKDGETVRQAIAEAITILSYSDVDVSEEISKIKNGIKGKNIRVAIHNALYKLSKAPAKPEPYQGNRYCVISPSIIIPDNIIRDDTIMSAPYSHEGVNFKNNLQSVHWYSTDASSKVSKWETIDEWTERTGKDQSANTYYVGLTLDHAISIPNGSGCINPSALALRYEVTLNDGRTPFITTEGYSSTFTDVKPLTRIFPDYHHSPNYSESASSDFWPSNEFLNIECGYATVSGRSDRRYALTNITIGLYNANTDVGRTDSKVIFLPDEVSEAYLHIYY